MKLIKTTLTIAFALFYFMAFSQNNLYIEGEQSACVGNCLPYYINTQNGPAIGAKFSVLGPDGTTTNTCYSDKLINQETAHELCFFCPGTYKLLAFFGGQVDSFFVRVSPFTDIDIQPLDGVGCQTNNKLDQTVCANETQTYFVPNTVPNSIVTWTVNNAKSYTINGDKIEVTWGSSGIGYLNAFAFASDSLGNGCGGESRFIVEILKELNIDFSTNGNVFCVGESIFPEPTITDATYYEWDFGNGQKSNDIKPEIAYDTPGTYTISLLVKNECGCTGTITKEVTIKDKYKPVIDCKSTICENTKVTYTSNADCGTFLWKVIGDGKITSGGQAADKSITIDWGKGPQGIIELEVQACNFDLCPEKAVFEIPIVSENAKISGELVACNGSLEYYTIQKYGATQYDWTVAGGTIVSGQGSNGIVVKWTDFNNGKLAVKYNNCYLKCGGEDELQVLIKPTYTLSVAQKEICIGDVLIANASSTINTPITVGTWSVKDENGKVLLNESNKTNINFVVPDNVTKLVITTSSGDLCNGLQSQTVLVLPKSEGPKGILGETSICQGQAYVYTVDKNLNSANYTWTIKDGASVSTSSGEEIIVTWNSNGPYKLELQQIDLSANFCTSNPFAINPSKLTSIDFIGNAESCLYDEYTLDATFYEGLEYNWQIIPNDAATIISTDKSSVKLKWNKVGSHKIELSNCAGTFTKNVLINVLPTVAINHPASLCENVLTNVSTVATYNAYLWKNSDGIIESTLANPSVFPGTYTCEATDAKGCKNTESFTIKALPKPNIFLSTPENNAVCLTTPPVSFPKLYALDSEDGYSYEWYKNGVVLGNTTNTYLSSDIGSYKVEVTDAFGCKNLSNDLSVYDLCDPNGGGGGGGGGGGTPSCNSTIGTVDFTSNPLDCNTVEFTSAALGAIAASEEWNFEDVASGINNYATGFKVTHDFYNAGFYKITHLVKVDDSNNPGNLCLKYITKAIEVPISANFDFINACQGETIEFYDRSTFIPGRNITSWAWDFDDPSSGSSNVSSLPDPTHVFANDGTYNVKLTISDGTCTDVFVLKVTLHPKLTPSISDSLARCENETAALYLSDLKDVLNVKWNFGDNASGSSNVQETFQGHHTYITNGNYTIKANIKSIYNCPSEVTSTIAIEKNTLSGNIVSSGGDVLCDGQNTTLSITNAATKWAWSTEETSSTIKAEKTGIYLLTVTDIYGCKYSPTDKQIKFNPLPQTSLVSTISKDEVEIKDYDNTIEFCQGFDFKIQALSTATWSYQWNNGVVNNDATYAIAQPSANTYKFNLTIKDILTNCSNTIDPITVIVNGLPSNIAISANAPAPLCESANHTLSVTSPSPVLLYKWSNGVKGVSTPAKAAGNYFVIGKDAKGCEGRSNDIEVLSGPDYNLVPAGCFERCAPDSMCYPSIANVVSYKWYKDNVDIDATLGGNTAYPIFTQSGTYHVEMVGTNGCVSQSESLNLTLKQAFGVVTGKVYVDKNNNGIIDPLDSLAKDIIVSINGLTNTTNANGVYTFDPIAAGSYSVGIDANAMPIGYAALLNNLLAKIGTCDDTARADLLIGRNSAPSFSKSLHILCTEKEINIGNKKFERDTIYTELKLGSTGNIDTIAHDIKFARKLEFKTTKEASCENNATGSFTIVNLGSQLFKTYIDNVFSANNAVGNLGKGNHSLLLIDDIGCKTESKFDIEIKQEAKFAVKTEDISCVKGYADLALDLQNYALSDVVVKWSNGESGGNIKVDKPGTLNVSVDNGCAAVQESVNVKSEKGKYTLKNYIVCSGVSLDLLGNNFKADTTFTLTEKAQGVCVDTTSYDLKFSQKFVYDLKVEGSCKDEDNGKLFLNMKSLGKYTYLLSGDEVSFDNGSIENLAPKKYQLIIKDKIGCEQTEKIDLKTKEAVEYEVVNDGITCFKGSADVGLKITNYKVEDLTFAWNHNPTTAITEIVNAGDYTVTVDNGCEAVSETITVENIDKRPSFLLPNVFVPDGNSANAAIDLNNTEFKDAEIKSFAIFDRAGMMVYSSQANNKVWDGTLRGNLLTTGVYVYNIEASLEVCGKIETIKKAGTITLVR